MEFVMTLEDTAVKKLRPQRLIGIVSACFNSQSKSIELTIEPHKPLYLIGLPGIIGRTDFVKKTSKPFNSGLMAEFVGAVRSFFVFCGLFGAMVLSGCGPDVPKEPYLFAGGYVHHETVELGRRVYVRNCQACHGKDGDGRGPSSPGLSSAPRDLTKGVFRFAAVPPGYDLPRDEELMRVLDHGLQGTSMLALDLQPTEKLAVLQYIKTFSEAWLDASKKVAPARIPTEDPYGPKSSVAIAAGERAYHGKAMCWSCHPAYVPNDVIRNYQTSYGREPTTGLRENMSRSVRMWPVPPDYTWDKVKISTSPEAVYRTLYNGLLGSVMPAYREILEDEEMWAVAHYVNALVEGEIKSFATVGQVGKTADEAANDVLKSPIVSKPVSGETGQKIDEKIRNPKAVLSTYGCLGCHSVDAPTPGLGPTLYDVGLRLDEAALLQSIIEPDAVMSVGFENLSGLMSTSLNGNRFYQDVSEKELSALVQYLSGKVGND
jgi:mono/diheme cytochrome c family protein